jgi:hypothetical protein
MDHPEFLQRYHQGLLRVTITDNLVRAAMKHPTLISSPRRVAYAFWVTIEILIFLAIIPIWIWLGWMYGVGTLLATGVMNNANRKSGREFILETILEDPGAYLILAQTPGLIKIDHVTVTDTTS